MPAPNQGRLVNNACRQPGPERLPEVNAERQFFHSRLRWILLSLVFLAALSARVYRVKDPPTAFHATRQYRSALIARAYYYDTVDALPEWKKRNAAIWRNKLGVLEPPIMEFLASTAYRLTGGEHLWIPRIMSATFWLLGGILLYRLVLRVEGTDAAVFSCTVYLFIPKGIPASCSFQPDPLMVMLCLSGIYLIVKYSHSPSARGLAGAAIVSGLAMLVKPICIFPIAGAFLSLAISRDGLLRSMIRRDVYVFFGVSLLPTAIYYIHGMFIGGFLKGQAQSSFLPHLWFEPSFWSRWLRLVRSMIGYPALAGGLLGIAMFRAGPARALVMGLWLGYLVLGLVFTYHIASHDYYHLLLIPIVAVSLSPIGGSILNRVQMTCRRRYSRAAVVGVLVVAMLLWVHHARWRRESNAPMIVPPALAIGEVVNHSDRTIFLAHEYGRPLAYHAEIAGVNWPSTGEQRTKRMRGKPRLSASERFEQIRQRTSPDYFIVTDGQQFDKQHDLRKLLLTRFPILVQTERYLIFDLRERDSADAP